MPARLSAGRGDSRDGNNPTIQRATVKWCGKPGEMSAKGLWYVHRSAFDYQDCRHFFEPAEPVAEPPAPPEIPADLKVFYEQAKKGISIGSPPWYSRTLVELIERIAALEGKRA